MSRCGVCFRHCEIPEGKTGFCGARTCSDGEVVCSNYGRITAIALDPIEKKPLARFMPGSKILSVGSYGCNLRCPFCQNSEISWSDEAMALGKSAAAVSPEQLADMALAAKPRGNVGLAFTYNEPMIGYEFVRDTAKLVKERGMVNALVTNGTAETAILEEILPYIDAMNVDLKGFTDGYYRDVLRGDRRMVMDFISRAAEECHVEVTTLIVPGENDSEGEMRELSGWLAELGEGLGRDIPLHISRFFPRFRMTDRDATDVALVYRLAETARERLRFVYTGNC